MANLVDKLANECYEYVEGTLDGDITVFDHKKFAALLIKEYEQLLPVNCPWVNASENGPMKGWHVAFVARKHFGLE